MGWFTHVVADEATQEQSLENLFDRVWPEKCENHVRELRTFFTVVLEPNIHTFSVLSETLPDFLKSKLC